MSLDLTDDQREFLEGVKDPRMRKSLAMDLSWAMRTHEKIVKEMDPRKIMAMTAGQFHETLFGHSEEPDRQMTLDEAIEKTRLVIEQGITNEERNAINSATMMVCRRCGCKEIRIELKQTRGADEATTAFCVCTNGKCGIRWKM